MTKHMNGDAFMLFRYEGPGGRREWVWNSRDGVTPFCIPSADGQAELQHANWHLDRYAPYYVPPVGSRIFVDLTEDLARPLAVKYVEKNWDREDYPMKDHPVFQPLGKEGAVEYVIKTWISDWGGHAPHPVVVTEALHAQFRARAEAPRS